MNAQRAITPEQQKAHHEHLGWLNDCGQWRSDHRQALASLAKVQAAILAQEAALESHAATVQSHERQLRDIKFADEEPEAFAENELMEQHDRVREAHERMRSHHCAILTEVEKLLSLCESAM